MRYKASMIVSLSMCLPCPQSKARSEGLWNLFLPLESDPDSRYGTGLTNLEYAHLAEMMGHSIFASEVTTPSQLELVLLCLVMSYWFSHYLPLLSL